MPISNISNSQEVRINHPNYLFYKKTSARAFIHNAPFTFCTRHAIFEIRAINAHFQPCKNLQMYHTFQCNKLLNNKFLNQPRCQK
jgi:hypothetical protein